MLWSLRRWFTASTILLLVGASTLSGEELNCETDPILFGYWGSKITHHKIHAATLEKWATELEEKSEEQPSFEQEYRRILLEWVAYCESQKTARKMGLSAGVGDVSKMALSTVFEELNGESASGLARYADRLKRENPEEWQRYFNNQLADDVLQDSEKFSDRAFSYQNLKIGMTPSEAFAVTDWTFDLFAVDGASFRYSVVTEGMRGVRDVVATFFRGSLTEIVVFYEVPPTKAELDGFFAAIKAKYHVEEIGIRGRESEGDAVGGVDLSEPDESYDPDENQRKPTEPKTATFQNGDVSIEVVFAPKTEIIPQSTPPQFRTGPPIAEEMMLVIKIRCEALVRAIQQEYEAHQARDIAEKFDY